MSTVRPLVTLLLAVSFGAPTLAATITVDTTADTLAADGGCSLREAITAANGDVPAFDCPTGDGPDRIVFALPPGAVILLQADLPTITESLAIRGPGAQQLEISGDGAFRALHFDSPGNDQWFAISDLTINKCLSPAAAVPLGGALLLDSAERLEATDIVFADNQSVNGGGAAYFGADSVAQLTRCMFTENVALGAAGGGAIGLGELAHVELLDSTVVGNATTGTGSGGGINAGRGRLFLFRSTISGNKTLRNGGGISMFPGVGVVAALHLVDSTVTNNTADLDSDGNGEGGGIHLSLGANTPIPEFALHNSIVAGNSDESASAPTPDINVVGPVTLDPSSSHNLIGANDGAAILFPVGDPNVDGNFVGFVSDPINAHLDPIAANGGSTLTHRPQVVPGTRVVDHGSCPAEAADQRGFGDQPGQRIVDDPTVSNHGASDGCDIGAVERGALAGGSIEIFADGFETGHTLRWSSELL